MISNRDILEGETRHTSGFYAKRGIAIVRGKGALLWDADGNQYIDCASGHGVALLGHCNPEIIAAVRQQAERLITCQEAFANDTRATLQEMLTPMLPGTMDRLFFCNSGTEAIEAALKIARLQTGKTGIIAAMNSFHGRTMGALSATWNPKYRKPFEPLLPGISHVPFSNLERLKAAIDQDTAAVILEIVQGEGGVNPGSQDYLSGAARLCKEHDILLIIDEVQTGFGRTGKWFASDHFDLAPDLICLGKGIAGGLPMGAVGISSRLKSLPTGAHGSTFGGNPLSCAAAIASISALQNEKLPDQARLKGEQFKAMLEAIESPLIKEIRGMGLMLGLELRTRSGAFIKTLQERGVITIPAGPTVIRFLPPLVITEQQIETVANTVGSVLREAGNA